MVGLNKRFLILSVLLLIQGRLHSEVSPFCYVVPELRTNAHAIYVSVTTLYFQADSSLPEVRIRLFFDDLQRCAQEEWGLAERPTLDLFVENGGMQTYLDDHMQLKLNDIPIPLLFDRIEPDQDDALSVYIKCELDETLMKDIAKLKVIDFKTDFFTEQIEAQQNLVRIRYGKQREFYNLDRFITQLQFKPE
jgi:hypothetical protein